MLFKFRCNGCGGVFRESGETRVHFGACGCSVRPTVELVDGEAAVMLRDRKTGRLTIPCRPPIDGYWYASGHGVGASAPTELEAIKRWRSVLEDHQRELDEAAHRLVHMRAHEREEDRR